MDRVGFGHVVMDVKDVFRRLYSQTKLEDWLMCFGRRKSIVHLLFIWTSANEFGSLIGAKFIRSRFIFFFFSHM